MKVINLLLILSLVLLILIFSASVFGQEYQNKSYFNKDQFTDYNFKVNNELNYFNYSKLKKDNQLALIKQKGNFNQAKIWQ
jgi:hypothetical protein